ncbi:MAG: hypothetical protein JWN04_3914, partial [Myxococcaceae bacterium]|nr:hypothetical protein [Myxococcaceae bacterium]
MKTKRIELENIQGNVLGGFNKDFQDFVFAEVVDAVKARAWVREHAPQVASAKQVVAFNNKFRKLKDMGVAKPEHFISASWLNIAFSFAGLVKLGFTREELGGLPVAFEASMESRAATVGDIGPSAPAKWLAPFAPSQRSSLHVLLIVAADHESDLIDLKAGLVDQPAFTAAFRIVGTEKGRTRVDQVGHEHFGFKDGVSQPGIRGLDLPDDPVADPDQGHPGQDLLWPGEFVLGYPTQIPTAAPGHDGPNPNPGPPSETGNPAWTNDGSFLVFRRLQQDVPAFHEQLAVLAKNSGQTVDLLGAKLVGRYRSGCPLEKLTSQASNAPASPTDPAEASPLLADSDLLNNDFEFGEDALGERCPLAAHIRKVYPRDEDTGLGADSESATQTHRLLRRGIPYGASFGAEVGGEAAAPRGLLFLAYQKDIE